MTTLAEVLDATVEFRRREFATPLRLSSGPITEVTVAEATVRARAGRAEAVGRGAVCLSHLWAWPQPSACFAEKEADMRELCELIADKLVSLCGDGPAHPLQLGLHSHDALRATGPEGMPPLARLVCLSPFDAAIHDAAGRALGRSAFALYDEPVPIPSVDAFFPSGGAVGAVRRLLRGPSGKLEAWLTIGVDECVPEVLAPWIRRCGYRCFKLKLTGRDTLVDVTQTVLLYRLVTELGVERPLIATDSNCGNPDADSVLDYLSFLEADHPAVFSSIAYLEQPTSPDLMSCRQDWGSVARLKPVILDEGLVDLATLFDAKAQKWSGIAVKTCKGHSMALVTAAWAYEHGMQMVMQDLTNPGIAAIHSALLAAHLPVTNGLELNSPRYMPEANSDWLPRLAELFYPVSGFHLVPSPTPSGLGTAL